MLLSYYWKRECNVDVTWEKNIPICILLIFEIHVELNRGKKYIYKKEAEVTYISTLLTSVFIFGKNSTNAGYIKGNNCTDAKYISLCGNQFICWPPIVHTPPWTEKPDNLVKNGESRAAYFSITSVNYFETQIERDRGCQILKDTRTSM